LFTLLRSFFLGRRFLGLLRRRLLHSRFLRLCRCFLSRRLRRHGCLFCRCRCLFGLFFANDQLFFLGFDETIGLAQLLILQRRQLRFVIKIVFFEIHSILPWGNRFARRIGAAAAANGPRTQQTTVALVSYSAGNVKDSDKSWGGARQSRLSMAA